MKRLTEKWSSIIIKFTCGLFFILISNGCTSENSADKIELIESQKIGLADLTGPKTNAKKIYYSLPAPHEVASLLLDDLGSEYAPSLLNDVHNLAKYASSMSMAINLGIYSADLSYVALLNQNQEVLGYFGNIKKLSKNLGILDIVGEATLNKLKDNYANRDYVFNAVSEAFMNSNIYLRNSDREEFLAMILVGGYMEGLFLATQLSNKSLTQNTDLVDKIKSQQMTLELMLKYYETLSQEANIVNIKNQLKELNNFYSKINTQNPTEADYAQFCNYVQTVRISFIKLN